MPPSQGPARGETRESGGKDREFLWVVRSPASSLVINFVSTEGSTGDDGSARMIDKDGSENNMVSDVRKIVEDTLDESL